MLADFEIPKLEENRPLTVTLCKNGGYVSEQTKRPTRFKFRNL